MNYIKVKDHPGLVRDSQSKAILNTNDIALAKYREERDKQLRIQRAIEDVDGLKQDVDEIKAMLKKLLEKI